MEPSDPKETSDLQAMVCPKCEAKFFPNEDGKSYHLRWATGAIGDPRDLAGLVCQLAGDASCINPHRADTSGDTWAKRRRELSMLEDLAPHEIRERFKKQDKEA